VSMADLFLGEDVDATHARTGTKVMLPSGELTTHGVIVGMTGSGKTGLGIDLIEECLSNNIPTLLIDPKGDLGNLCLTFPNLAPGDFQPWVNADDAAKAGQSVPDFAAAQAKSWTDGLAGWGITADRIAALRQHVEFTIYTPGSTAGVPLNIVGSLQAPADTSDVEIMRDEIDGYVSGLLGLVGIDADPLSSREHILLSNLIETAWTGGKNLDLAILVGQVQSPPIRKLGVFDLDTFYPPKDRMVLAMKLNGLLASPSFAAWAQGPPIDIDNLMHTPDGRTRCAIISVGMLSDQERQFVTTLVLSKLVTWMRRQSGTTDLRALVYMDEVAGYVPPTANPPTKQPIMTLMKQARAFGLGVVLATQNPVDLDYKAISNAGTWMIGRLQTDQDKNRLLDGMNAATGGVDVQAVGDRIAGLAKREFVLRRAGKDKPESFATRWAMSYLRGPLTRDQIQTLMHDQAAAAAAQSPQAVPTATVDGQPAYAAASGGPSGSATVLGTNETPVMPAVADGIAVRYVDVASPWLESVGGDTHGTRLGAAIIARVQMHYDDTKAGVAQDEQYETVIYPIDALVDASKAVAVDYDDRDLRPDAPSPAVYTLTDAPIKDKAFWTKIQGGIVDSLVRSQTLAVGVNPDLKLYSRPGETGDQFAYRCGQAASEGASQDAAALQAKYQTKIDRLNDQVATAQDRTGVLQQQQSARRNTEILGTAGSVLGSILGGRGGFGSILGKLGTAVTRQGSTKTAGARADAAQNRVDQIQQNVQELENELAQELNDINNQWMNKARNITTTEIPLERTDVSVSQIVLGWLPC
jgi:Helicase HerA, central domain